MIFITLIAQLHKWSKTTTAYFLSEKMRIFTISIVNTKGWYSGGIRASPKKTTALLIIIFLKSQRLMKYSVIPSKEPSTIGMDIWNWRKDFLLTESFRVDTVLQTIRMKFSKSFFTGLTLLLNRLIPRWLRKVVCSVLLLVGFDINKIARRRTWWWM